MKPQQTTPGSMRHTRCLVFVTLGFMLCAAKAQTTYQNAVLADSPLAYYALNPGTDGTSAAPDLTGNGNNGFSDNITPGIGPTPYITNAASFDGSSSFVDLSTGNNPGLLISAGPITLEAWVKPASSSEFADIIAQGYENTTGYPEIALRVNGPYGANYAGGSENSGFSVYASGGTQTTNWTCVVLSMDGTNCSLYENARLVAQSPDTNGSTIFPSPDAWVIGDGSDAGNSRLFSGTVIRSLVPQHPLVTCIGGFILRSGLWN